MPKLLCKCGKLLRYGEIPCPIEWRIIADTTFEMFAGQVDAEAVYRATQTVLRCSSMREAVGILGEKRYAEGIHSRGRRR